MAEPPRSFPSDTQLGYDLARGPRTLLFCFRLLDLLEKWKKSRTRHGYLVQPAVHLRQQRNVARGLRHGAGPRSPQITHTVCLCDGSQILPGNVSNADLRDQILRDYALF